MIKEKEYYIFSNDLYDNIKMCFTKNTINCLIKYWEEGFGAPKIAKKLHLKDIEIFLLISDLQITGLLPERDRDFYGRPLKKG